MPTLGELARLIRSKNAGAFTLTFDIMFETEDAYRKVLASKVLTKKSFSALYNVAEEDVLFFEHDAAMAIKISIPRPYVQGSREDGDVYGGQQHALLVDLDIAPLADRRACSQSRVPDSPQDRPRPQE
jgi:hypothetical protein